MDILKSKNLSDLPVAQRRLVLSQLAGDLDVWVVLSQELLGRTLDGDGVVGSIEDLEAKPALLDGQVTDLTEVTGVDVTPGVALPRRRVVDVLGEVESVLVRLNHVADAQGVDVVSEAAGKGAGRLLVADL